VKSPIVVYTAAMGVRIPNGGRKKKHVETKRQQIREVLRIPNGGRKTMATTSGWQL